MAALHLFERARAWARAREARIGRHNPWEVAYHVVRNSIEDRVTGLAAEMAFFALLSLVPLFVTIGAALGYLERFVGAEGIDQAEALIVRGLGVVFSPRVTAEIITPFTQALLNQQRGGLALGALAVTLFLASRVFTATIRSLDLAYGVPERRGAVAQRLLALGLSLGFVVVVVATLAFMVVGPLLGSGQTLASRFGLGDAFRIAWGAGRWPTVVVITVGFLSCVYHFGPNLTTRWRHSLPGAILGLVLWLLASLCLRLYLAYGPGDAAALVAEDQAVQVVARSLGAVVATVLWTYLTGLAILVGGELNAHMAGR